MAAAMLVKWVGKRKAIYIYIYIYKKQYHIIVYNSIIHYIMSYDMI